MIDALLRLRFTGQAVNRSLFLLYGKLHALSNYIPRGGLSVPQMNMYNKAD